MINHLLELTKPGIRIKRWLILVVLGVAMLSYGVGSELRNVLFAQDESVRAMVRVVTLQHVPLRNYWLILIGGGLILIGGHSLLRALTAPFSVPASNRDWLRQLAEYHELIISPRVTIVGVSTNLVSILRSIKLAVNDLTIVFATPDGVYTQQELLAAARPLVLSLAQIEPLTETTFEQPVTAEGPGAQITIGEALLTAVTNVEGSVEAGLHVAGQVLAMKGRVLPALSAVASSGPLQPSFEAVRAIIDTDLLILAPTSPDELTNRVFRHLPLLNAVKLSQGLVICLLPPAAQLERLGFVPGDYLKALAEMLDQRTVQLALVDDPGQPPEQTADVIRRQTEQVGGTCIVRLRLTDDEEPAVFSPALLADALLTLHELFGRRFRRRLLRRHS
jgi:hypothetical protein